MTTKEQLGMTAISRSVSVPSCFHFLNLFVVLAGRDEVALRLQFWLRAQILCLVLRASHIFPLGHSRSAPSYSSAIPPSCKIALLSVARNIASKSDVHTFELDGSRSMEDERCNPTDTVNSWSSYV